VTSLVHTVRYRTCGIGFILWYLCYGSSYILEGYRTRLHFGLFSFKLLEILLCVTVCKYHMPHDLTGSCRVADPHTFDPDPDPAF
jgi:hypothetical protein